MELTDAVPFLTDHQQAVIVTMGEGDVPHASSVLAHFDGAVFRISVTDGRVKTGNLRRRPLAVLHVSSDDFWRWVAAECDVELSDVAAEAGDAVTTELLEVYEALTGPHPHPDEFLQAMVDDHRLVLRCTPRRVYGQLG